MRNLRGIYTIWYRDILRFWHDKIRLMGAITFPLLFLFVFGSGLGARMGSLSAGVDFTQFMFPGIIGMTVLMSSFTAGVSVVWDREFGFLKEVLVAPLSRSGIVLGKAVGAAAVAVGQSLLMLVLAPVLGVKLTPLLVLKLIPLLILLSVSLSGLGLLVASRMRSQQGFQVVVQIIVFPMLFVSGVFFPVNNVPMWLEVLSKINPLTYGVDAVRRIFLPSALGVNVLGHITTVWEDVAIVGLLGVVLMALAIWFFGRQE